MNNVFVILGFPTPRGTAARWSLGIVTAPTLLDARRFVQQFLLVQGMDPVGILLTDISIEQFNFASPTVRLFSVNELQSPR